MQIDKQSDKHRRRACIRAGEAMLKMHHRLRNRGLWSTELERKFRRNATELIHAWASGGNSFPAGLDQSGDASIGEYQQQGKDGRWRMVKMKKRFHFDAFDEWHPENLKAAFKSRILHESQNRLFLEIHPHTTKNDIAGRWDLIKSWQEETFGPQPRFRGQDDGWAKSFERFFRHDIKGMTFPEIAKAEKKEKSRWALKVEQKHADRDNESSPTGSEPLPLFEIIKKDVGRFRKKTNL